MNKYAEALIMENFSRGLQERFSQVLSSFKGWWPGDGGKAWAPRIKTAGNQGKICTAHTPLAKARKSAAKDHLGAQRVVSVSRVL